ncbi:hypothetical protein ACS0TY_016089 [Phlomoides rotata]
MFAGLDESALAMNLNFVFTGGEYNGSSLCILGRNPIDSKNRELPPWYDLRFVQFGVLQTLVGVGLGKMNNGAVGVGLGKMNSGAVGLIWGR